MERSPGTRKIIGESLAIQTLVRLIEKVAPSKTNILVTGESGTGKELIARSIHDNSPLHGKPFVAINCGAIPETLIESELFGHKKGSFTGAVSDKAGLFESATGGTLFLDEIGELPLSMQVKLLRAIQERIIRRVGDNQDIRIDVRIIAATNRDLEREVKAGKFREDLFYRLNVIQIKAPPLRERGRDIEVLARYFLQKFSQQQKKELIDFSPEALVKISQYEWPGNVRQLENVIERAVTLESNPQITVDCLPIEIRTLAITKPQSMPEWSQAPQGSAPSTSPIYSTV
jgi:two-component system response regulator PilR (NtrC family)